MCTCRLHGKDQSSDITIMNKHACRLVKVIINYTRKSSRQHWTPDILKSKSFRRAVELKYTWIFRLKKIGHCRRKLRLTSCFASFQNVILVDYLQHATFLPVEVYIEPWNCMASGAQKAADTKLNSQMLYSCCAYAHEVTLA